MHYLDMFHYNEVVRQVQENMYAPCDILLLDVKSIHS